MANIIRCKLPDGVHRFKPFTIADYRDFLLVRNDMVANPDDDHAAIVDELTQDYFSEYPKSWRHYVFLNVFTGSIGKTKIPIVYECPICGKAHKRLFNLSQEPLVAPRLKLNETVELIFKFPDETFDDSAELVMNSISTVIHAGTEYNWTDLSKTTQDDILGLLDLDKFEEIVKKLKPIYFEMVLTCCEKNLLVYDNLESIFKLLINPDEVFPFYEINHILTKNSYSHDAIMKMLPAERSIALKLIEKDNKK